MLKWLTFFIDICRLKARPEDAPHSRVMYLSSVLAYWSAGIIILVFSQSLLESVFLSTVQVALMIFVTKMGLWIKKTPERDVQTITALAGSGTLIALAALPLSTWSTMLDPNDANILFTIIWISLVVWEVIVVAHVLRHALELPFAAGLGIALIFMYLSFAITLRFMKVIAISPT